MVSSGRGRRAGGARPAGDGYVEGGV